MEYQFSFDKKRLILVVGGLIFVGVLTFFCGVVTGIGLWTPSQKVLGQYKAQPKLPAHTAVKPPELPGAPAVPAELTRIMKTPAAASAPAPAPLPATPPIVPGASAPPVDAQPAAATPVAVPDPVNQPFVLQLGAFREQKNANQLQADLKLKGYPTTIFNMMDEDQRTWHMVRFGGYKDLSAASTAASNFTGKEGIQALVRRSDSL